VEQIKWEEKQTKL